MCAVLMVGCASGSKGPGAVRAPSTESRTTATSPVGADQNARAIVDAADAISYGSAVDEHGDLITLWSTGYSADAPTAIAIRTARGRRSLHLGGMGLHIYASVPAGWVVGPLTGPEHFQLAQADGTLTTILDSSLRKVARPGDYLVSRFYQPRLFRPANHTTYRLESDASSSRSRGLVSAVAPDGALLSLATHRGIVEVGRFIDHSWSHTQIDSGPGVAQGDIIVQVGNYLVTYTTYHPAPLGDDAEDPVHLIAVSTDAGVHWHATRAPAGKSVVTSITISRRATAFVTVGAPHGKCSLIRVPLNATAACVRLPRTSQILSDPNDLYAVPFNQRPSRLLVSTDDGTHWKTVSVPGRE